MKHSFLDLLGKRWEGRGMISYLKVERLEIGQTFKSRMLFSQQFITPGGKIDVTNRIVKMYIGFAGRSKKSEWDQLQGKHGKKKL